VKRWTIVALACAVWGCGSNGDASKTSADSSKAAASGSGGMGSDLNGAGATFPEPIYHKWFDEYAGKAGVKINYQAIGSGGGIKQLQEQTVDFGASDAPMSDAEMQAAKGGPVMHFPTVIGAVAIAYNLPGVTQPIKLTGPVVADMFLGKITKWSDSRIAALNSGVKLPPTDILIAHRSDGSGTTYIFSDYLSTVSPAWKAGPGKGKDLQWPVGLGGKGNDGVSGVVKQTAGGVGYVELAYAKQNNIPTALLQNAAGQFVGPSVEGATAAAQGAVTSLGTNTDYRISIVNAPGAQAYPIASFTWLLVYKTMPDAAKAKKLADYLKWMYSTGESEASTLFYAPLPQSLVSQLTTRVDSVAAGTAK
jgi:phosphate transport system substrate-binding protein